MLCWYGGVLAVLSFPFSHLSDPAVSLAGRCEGLAPPSGTLVGGKRSLLRHGRPAALYSGGPSHLLCAERKADSWARMGCKEGSDVIQLLSRAQPIPKS